MKLLSMLNALSSVLNAKLDVPLRRRITTPGGYQIKTGKFNRFNPQPRNINFIKANSCKTN